MKIYVMRICECCGEDTLCAEFDGRWLCAFCQLVELLVLEKVSGILRANEKVRRN